MCWVYFTQETKVTKWKKQNKVQVSPIAADDLAHKVPGHQQQLYQMMILLFSWYIPVLIVNWDQKVKWPELCFVYCQTGCEKLFTLHKSLNTLFSINSFWPSNAMIWWQIWVNIGSGKGLLPDGTKPLPDLCPVAFIWDWGLMQEILQPSLSKIRLKIIYLQFHLNLPGANELTHWPMGDTAVI